MSLWKRWETDWNWGFKEREMAYSNPFGKWVKKLKYEKTWVTFSWYADGWSVGVQKAPYVSATANRQHVATRLQVKVLKILFFGSFDQRQYLVLSLMLFSPHNYIRWRNCNEFLHTPHRGSQSPPIYLTQPHTLFSASAMTGKLWGRSLGKSDGSRLRSESSSPHSCAGVRSFHHAYMVGPRAPFGWLVCEPKIFWAILTFCESFPHFLLF